MAVDCVPYCNAAHANLKPAVAEAAVACLALDQTSYCLGGYSRITQALADACPDSSTQTDCATIATECDNVADPPCEDGFTEQSAGCPTNIVLRRSIFRNFSTSSFCFDAPFDTVSPGCDQSATLARM